MTLDPEMAADAAARWGTPLYLTDLDAAAARLATYQAVFPGALIAYAVKANADPQLLRRLVVDGAGCEVVTAVELALALRAGCPGERIVMNGVGKRDEELHLALAAGALVNAERCLKAGRRASPAAARRSTTSPPGTPRADPSRGRPCRLVGLGAVRAGGAGRRS